MAAPKSIKGGNWTDAFLRWHKRMKRQWIMILKSDLVFKMLLVICQLLLITSLVISTARLSKPFFIDLLANFGVLVLLSFLNLGLYYADRKGLPDKDELFGKLVVRSALIFIIVRLIISIMAGSQV